MARRNISKIELQISMGEHSCTSSPLNVFSYQLSRNQICEHKEIKKEDCDRTIEESFKDGVKRETKELYHKDKEIQKIVAEIDKAIEKGEDASVLYFRLGIETLKKIFEDEK